MHRRDIAEMGPEMARRMHYHPSMNSALARKGSTRRSHRRVMTRWRYRRSSHLRARTLFSPVDRGPDWLYGHSTMLELVQAIQDQVASDTEVVTIIRWLVNSGTVILAGSFAGQRIEEIG